MHRHEALRPVLGAEHAYVARREVAALLESARTMPCAAPHVSAGGERLTGLAHFTSRSDVRLTDLRDPALETLGIDRAQLAATDPGHHPWPSGDGELLELAAGPWPLDGRCGRELVRDVATRLGAPPPLTDPGSH